MRRSSRRHSRTRHQPSAPDRRTPTPHTPNRSRRHRACLGQQSSQRRIPEATASTQELRVTAACTYREQQMFHCARAGTVDARLGSMLMPTKILVPTDFSSNADQALDYALDLANKLGATVYLL